jgi:phenylalanyl-tRNA synthetase beta chain
MKVTVNWIQKYLPELKIDDIQQFRHKIDTRLTEVEDVEIKGRGLANLIAVEIVESVEHPTSNKLRVCKVNIGEAELVQVVCGAPNALVGLKTILCPPGGSVVDPQDHSKEISIGSRAVAGVQSNGMLCSPAELGLSHIHENIIELPSSTPNGMPLTELFKDTVVEIQNKAIPHRPDCFSHVGLARELGTIFKTKMVGDAVEQLTDFTVTADDQIDFAVEIKATDACQRFTAIALTNITVAPSPLWLQIQLIYCGIRPINNVVDATNYVMLDIGQPLHAFDFDKIAGNKIIVRNAAKNEKITTLDGKERVLTNSMVVVADKEKPQAVAGIIGGQDSEITTQTKTIVLEAGNWEMYQTRGTSRVLGVRTEASGRFEKGISPQLTKIALYKAAQMISDLAGGEIASPIYDYNPNPQSNQIVAFNTGLVKRLLGIEMDKEDLIDILESLGIEVINKNQIPAEAMGRDEINTELSLDIPYYRRDLKKQEDILEEIGRMYGYENVQPSLPNRNVAPNTLNKRLTILREVKLRIVAAGFNEIYTYPMVGQDMYDSATMDTTDLIKIKNPISPELAMVRNQILPSLLNKVHINLDDGYINFGLFEVDKVAIKERQANGLPKQIVKAAGIFVATDEDEALAYVHKAIRLLSQALQQPIHVRQNSKIADKYGYLHPGKAGELYVGDNAIGAVGITHQQVNDNFYIKGMHVAGFEIHELEKLIDNVIESNPVRPYQPISDQPAVIRDISMWDSEKVSEAGELVRFIKSQQIPQLVGFDVLDIFINEAGRRSITFRSYLQDQDKTLEANEITELTDKLAKLLTGKGLTIR